MRYLIFALVLLAACKKSYNLVLVPDSLFYRVTKNGTQLPDSVLTKTKMYYLESNSKKYISDLIAATEPINGLGIQTTRSIGHISGDNKVKDFYLEYGNGDIDTVYVDYQHLSDKDAQKSDCKCLYPRIEVRFNGKRVEFDTSIYTNQVYLFKK